MANTSYTKRVIVGPKRRIEKVHSQVQVAVTNSVGNVILHTAEDKKTLVRIVANGTFHNTDGVAASFNYIIGREPRGVAIMVPSVAGNLDEAVGKELIYSAVGAFVAGSQEPIPQQFDIKGMRKLGETDEIVLRYLGSHATTGLLMLDVTMFFKE